PRTHFLKVQAQDCRLIRKRHTPPWLAHHVKPVHENPYPRSWGVAPAQCAYVAKWRKNPVQYPAGCHPYQRVPLEYASGCPSGVQHIVDINVSFELIALGQGVVGETNNILNLQPSSAAPCAKLRRANKLFKLMGATGQ